MSNMSNDIGRAFEYACIIELKKRISEFRPVTIIEDTVVPSLRAWNYITKITQANLKKAAEAYIDTLFSAEPLILEYEDNNDIIELYINKDSDAEAGDVRDIVINRGAIRWDIGLSMKHNHFAAKHSRLSESIDFGSKWYGIPCSNTYWDTIHPIFDGLKALKKAEVKWKDMYDKENTVYIPLLNAFKNEIERAYNQDKRIPVKLLSYLLGTRDFYKVVAIDSKQITEFQSFNLRGELNHDGKHNKPTLIIPVAALPTEIISIRFKTNSTNTLELYLNNGWSLSFRIHNASTVVEPSLKFDVQFLGVPADILTVNCTWR